MTVADLGARESLHNLAVGWPNYFAYKREVAEAEAEKERHTRRGR
jgi:hypothetical protein